MFVLEKETQQAAELERYQQLLQQSREEAAGAKNQVVELDAQLREAIDALDAANRLSEQLDRKEEAMQALKEEGEKSRGGGGGMNGSKRERKHIYI